jgi:hypothetical protein
MQRPHDSAVLRIKALTTARHPKIAMSHYRYYFFDHHETLVAAKDGNQVTDFAAMDHARDLLACGRNLVSVQIWRAETFVTGFARAPRFLTEAMPAAALPRHEALAL